MIKVKRIYESPAKTDGRRILVDRLWPRGVSKVKARLDAWQKDAAPSPELRTWFHHDPERFMEFREKYLVELDDNAAAAELTDLARHGHRLTLLYAAKDPAINHAVVLKAFIEAQLS